MTASDIRDVNKLNRNIARMETIHDMLIKVIKTNEMMDCELEFIKSKVDAAIFKMTVVKNHIFANLNK